MKRILVSIIFLCAGIFLSAESVDKAELLKVKKDSVEFLNYEGPHSKIETAAQIRGIGILLGKKSGDSATYFNKYRILHIVDSNGHGLLNADIFSIEKNAVVDHIDNIRRILKGYLESYYGYTPEDGEVIAEFITFYNAYYRKNIDYFKTVYAGKVVAALDPDKAGISTRYMDWPGKTQMLIPLSPSPKEKRKVNIDTVSNHEVIEDLRTRKDKGIEPRKGMVEVKAKEITTEQKKIEEAKKTLSQEKKAVEAQKAAAEKESGTPAGQKVLAESARKEAEIKKKEKTLKVRETENAQRQAAVQQEREQIASDEKQLIAAKKGSAGSTTAKGTLVPFLLVTGSDPDMMGRFVLVNDKTGVLVKRSSLNTVRGRTFLLINGALFFISGVDKPPKAVRLTRMNKDTLEIEKEGNSDIYSGSVLVYHGESLYAVMRKEGKWYVGRFNTGLTLLSRSDIEVKPFTPLQFNGGTVYVEAASGTVQPLKADTLQLLPQSAEGNS